MTRCSTLLVLAAAAAPPVSAQAPPAEQARVLAVIDSALAAISREDMATLTDFMLDETVIYAVSEREGVTRYRARTRAGERATTFTEDLLERGFAPEVRIAGPVAMVWLPYDFHVDGQWSHCGVDIFTLIRGEQGWRIAALAYSVEQPPACQPHPAGPPGRP